LIVFDDLVRYGTPIGSLYATNQYELWNVGVRSKDAEERLEKQMNAVREVSRKAQNQVAVYWPTFKLKTPNVKASWNCWVKCSTNKLSTLDAQTVGHEIAAKWQSISNSLQSQTKYN
jgi:hypothetical protein